MSKRKNNRHKLSVIELVLLDALIVSGCMLVVTICNYGSDRSAYRAAADNAVSTPAPTAAITPLPQATDFMPQTTDAPPTETLPITVDFDQARAEGKHTRAWLYCADTIINYPVVWYTNNEYYLTHDYTGKGSKAGALFFDTRVGKELEGDMLVIYGHHMKDRSMFGSLLQYQKQEYYELHPRLFLLTPAQSYRIDLFAARFTNSDDKNYPIWFGSEEKRQTFIRQAIADSDFVPADQTPRENTRIVSLVTCAYSNYIEDAKYQVLGYLEPIG